MGNVDIDFYCRVYDDFLEPELCDAYIDLYEATLQLDAEKVRKLSICYREDGSQICGGCNCMRLNPHEYERFNSLNSLLNGKFQNILVQYKKDVNLHPLQFPNDFGWEELRIKRFLIEGSDKENHGKNNYHGLENHVDVYTHAHAKRFLCLMVYLNDDFEEGETHFSTFKMSVKPKKGRLFIFPPQWTYLHNGRRPLPPSNRMAKYFIMTHTNYTDLSEVNEYDGNTFQRETVAYDPNIKGMKPEEQAWPSSTGRSDKWH